MISDSGTRCGVTSMLPSERLRLTLLHLEVLVQQLAAHRVFALGVDGALHLEAAGIDGDVSIVRHCVLGSYST